METKICQSCKSNFVIEPEDFDFYKKIDVSAPTFCPDCRAVRRFVFRNEHLLFRNVDARTGKEIFSTWPKEANIPVYEHKFWWSDSWDPMDYGKDYDFSQPFFEQFKELLNKVPWDSRSVQRLVNSDYSNQASDLKNCYLCFNGDRAENSLYIVSFNDVKDSVDCTDVKGIELCRELFVCGACYQTFFSINCSNCREVWFSNDCDNCSNCFGCINLRHKQYHIFNKPYSKEEYQNKVKEFNLGSYSALEKVKLLVYEFWSKFPVKYMHGTRNVNAVGEYVYNSKNIRYCFETLDTENAKYCQNIIEGTADVYDYTSWGDHSELVYESVICGENCRNLKFCFDCWPGCEDLEYCNNCHASTNLFGCSGLKKKSYCILNKQYTKEEYENLVLKIKEHIDKMPYKDKMGRVYKYGEFFPPEFSALAYNETIAQDHYPLTKGEAEKKGFVWREPKTKDFEITLKAEDLPDSIHDANEGVCKEILGCKSCKKAFRILPQEFEFYKRFSLPLPRLCHACRYNNRIKFRNPMRWWKRRCMCDYKVYENFSKHEWHPEGRCPNKFETSYAPEREEIVYCEECYQKEVI